jgi:hypothetical protein
MSEQEKERFLYVVSMVVRFVLAGHAEDFTEETPFDVASQALDLYEEELRHD